MEKKSPQDLQEIEEDDDEALSLSDLPLIHHPEQNTHELLQAQEIESLAHDDFDFCSFSKESEMCAADEVFFQGQILPLRHSTSSEKQLSSRSESMDHYYSSRLISSRSSSISSHQSSSSGSSSAATRNSRSRLPPRNQFHSHPSPSPRLSLSSHNQRTTAASSRRNSSSVWNILRLGLVATPPEINDFKTRGGGNCNNFGSRNSTSSNGSSVSSIKSKKKARGLLGGCKCSMDAVDTISSRVVIIKRSASESDVEALQSGRENVEEVKPQKIKKKHMSHHRTFEWLKQLSVEGTTDES